MPQFTSSAKPIQYFCQTTLINEFASAMGDRLEQLKQIERQQLLICLSTWVYSIHAHRALSLSSTRQATLLENYGSSIDYQVTDKVLACLALLETEDVDNIAAILPAIAEYANNSSVQKENADH